MTELMSEFASQDESESTDAPAPSLGRGRMAGGSARKGAKKLPLPILLGSGAAGLVVLIGVTLYFVLTGSSGELKGPPVQSPPISAAPAESSGTTASATGGVPTRLPPGTGSNNPPSTPSAPMPWSTPPKRNTWVADSLMLDSLDEETGFPGETTLKFRPPKEYVKQELPIIMGKNATWVGNRRPDMSAPTLIVTVIPIPPGETFNENDPREFFRGIMTGLQQNGRFTNWQQTSIELGKINGLNFARIRWSGSVQPTNRTMKGVLYVVFHSRSAVSIGAQDLEPHEAETLKILEASAMSCRDGGS